MTTPKKPLPLKPLQEKLKAYSERMGDEKAKEYARSLGGFPKGMTVASVNGHTRGWDEGFTACAELMQGLVEALEYAGKYHQGAHSTVGITIREALSTLEKKLAARGEPTRPEEKGE